MRGKAMPPRLNPLPTDKTDGGCKKTAIMRSTNTINKELKSKKGKLQNSKLNNSDKGKLQNQHKEINTYKQRTRLKRIKNLQVNTKLHTRKTKSMTTPANVTREAGECNITTTKQPTSRMLLWNVNNQKDPTYKSKCTYIIKNTNNRQRYASAIWDSGATHGIHWCEDLFENIHKPYITSVKGINNFKTPITAAGTCQGIHEVLLMPSCTQPVISCSQFLDQHGGRLLISKNNITWLKNKRRIYVAERDSRGLYISAMSRLEANKIQKNTARANLSIQAQLLREKVHNLHRCLGHIGMKKMKQVLRRNNFTNLKEKDLQLMMSCDACDAGKIKRANKRKVATRRPTEFGHTVRSDTSSRQQISTKGKKRYANIIVDEATRWVWVTLLRNMKNTGELAIKPIVTRLHTEGKIKTFGSDMGTEFQNEYVTTLLQNLGIRRETACADNQQQNGLAERTIGILFETTRTLLADSKLPLSFWGEAIKFATYLRNRLPIESNQYGSSPYELRYGKQPEAIWYRMCDIKTQKQARRNKSKRKRIPWNLCRIWRRRGVQRLSRLPA